MHPQTSEALRLEAAFDSLRINKIDDPFIIGVDHNLSPYFKARSLFCLFSRLPPELKLMIWAAAANGRQIVRIKPRARDGTEGEGFRADYTMPVVLHVCRDSRREALKRYTVIFRGILRNPIYFNYQQNYIGLVGSSTCEHFEIRSGEDNAICKEIQKIENVLAMVTGLGSGESEEDVLVCMLSIWDGVKRLIIAESSPTWWGTFKEIWSDKEVKKLCKDAKANDIRERVATPDIPQVRIVKFDDILSAVVKEEKQSMDGTTAMLYFFDSLFEASSTYNIKRQSKKA
ncbi:predicted protein [Sclerotinia sclerotiorum 1980 UF-70]|uniref:2EXR domain-containing protein n=2 Tax=Sclerotinia sclerotiorum (strain ATCC 18683 / 1980 / Ss-1) TaxID=665079 RepID=A7EZA4_SCLS1|nr:predicted protein [Sclerotinia sclerotiorum 1980 UF-70]APA12310.1 hypothetical protein sscle_09g070800 [Sclerotinia sclerotiorum 1980 UF-70]EDN94796.1 predicted protein [Sclerotinia sclerotiorum 1980 UF-70]